MCGLLLLDARSLDRASDLWSVGGGGLLWCWSYGVGGFKVNRSIYERPTTRRHTRAHKLPRKHTLLTFGAGAGAGAAAAAGFLAPPPNSPPKGPLPPLLLLLLLLGADAAGGLAAATGLGAGLGATLGAGAGAVVVCGGGRGANGSRQRFSRDAINRR